MKKLYTGLSNTFVAGLLFLVPLLIFIVLIAKVLTLLEKITTRLAAAFGLGAVGGIPAHMVMGMLLLLLLCFACGYLVRVAFVKHVSAWLDNRLKRLVPGYELYHRMALSKLGGKEDSLAYQSPAWVKNEDGLQPAFIMESLPDGRLIVFLPTAGNVKEGNILVVDNDKVTPCNDADKRAFRMAVANLGLGLSKMYTRPAG